MHGAAETEGFVFTGSEGMLQVTGGAVALTRLARQPEPDYDIGSFAAATQAQFLAEFRRKYPPVHPSGDPSAEEQRYVAPPGYDDVFDHFKNFFEAVRARRPVVEDAVFGYRAAGAALLANVSSEEGRIVKWDPEGMKLL